MEVGIEHIFIVAAVGLTIITLMLLPDASRFFSRYLSYVFFFVALGLCTVTVARSGFNKDVSVNTPSIDIASMVDTGSKEQKTKTAIAECQAFVRVKQSGEVHPSEVEPAASGFSLASLQTRSMWEICADRFGENFWKFDTSIDGRRGGDVLCELYRKEGHQFEQVDVWCSTVFAPKGE